MLIDDLARSAVDLLGITNSGQTRSLNRLTEFAVREVPPCSGATAIVWRDAELAGISATHPDLAALAESELRTGRGPGMDALCTGKPCHCGDTVSESRWPEYTDEALCCGVRSVVALMHAAPPMSVVLSLYSVRPNALDGKQVPVAATLAALGSVALANASAYDDAQREALQLRDAVTSRAVVDQAKGILMHALGCDASDALDRMRQVSQRRHVKVTDVASQIIEAHGGLPLGQAVRVASSRRAGALTWRARANR